MYYSELVRVRRIEKFLERMAYSSMAFDVIVAVATLFIVEGGPAYYNFILMIGDYLIFVEVALTTVAFGAIVALKNYKVIAKKLDRAMFRMKRYRMIGRITKMQARA
jgi:hypothetical protein